MIDSLPHAKSYIPYFAVPLSPPPPAFSRASDECDKAFLKRLHGASARDIDGGAFYKIADDFATMRADTSSFRHFLISIFIKESWLAMLPVWPPPPAYFDGRRLVKRLAAIGGFMSRDK